MEEISVQTQIKIACAVCGNPTYITLRIGSNVISLCQKCLAKLIAEIYNKREDIISDVLIANKGMSLSDIDDLVEENHQKDERISELEMQVDKHTYSDDDYEDDYEDDEDGDCGWQ